MHPWLSRLRHDLLKRALWPARDISELLESARSPTPRDLQALREGLFALCAEDGSRCDARALFAELRTSAPAALSAASLDQFAHALEEAMAAASAPHPLAPALGKVLRLEALFAALTAELSGPTPAKRG